MVYYKVPNFSQSPTIILISVSMVFEDFVKYFPKPTKVIANSPLDEDKKNNIIQKISTIPCIYGWEKVHTEGHPFRPIVNTIYSPSYNLAKLLAKILKPLVGHT